MIRRPPILTRTDTHFPYTTLFRSSRTPVRAALKKLIEDGLAVSEEGRGVFIASWTRWDIEDMFRLRIRLEPFAARLASERADADAIQKLKQCNDQMAKAIEATRKDNSAITEVQTANSAFHHLLLDARSDERRVGKEWVSTCRAGRGRRHRKKKRIKDK